MIANRRSSIFSLILLLLSTVWQTTAKEFAAPRDIQGAKIFVGVMESMFLSEHELAPNCTESLNDAID